MKLQEGLEWSWSLSTTRTRTLSLCLLSLLFSVSWHTDFLYGVENMADFYTLHLSYGYGEKEAPFSTS